MTEDLRLDSATRARLTEAWLALGASLDLTSLAITMLAMAALLFGLEGSFAQVALLFAVVLGLLEKYYALRVAFDRRLFLHWAERWESLPEAKPEEDMARLDAALASAGMRKQPEQNIRDLADRQRGAFRLFRLQALALSAQGVTLLAVFLIAS